MVFSKFRRWGNYYPVVDWVVNKHKIQGITSVRMNIQKSTAIALQDETLLSIFILRYSVFI